MSVVRRAARRRWAAVAAGVLTLVAVPPALASLPVHEPPPAAAAHLAGLVLASETVGHDGLVEVEGRLGLPDLPRLDAASALLGGTTRARVWWASAQRWRVATLTATGERDVARTPGGRAEWDYGRNRTRFDEGEPAVRLPRTDDLLPPQAARRLLGGLGPRDRLETVPARRVAGRDAAGLRLVPGEPRSSVARVDVWVEPATGLPLALEVHAVGAPASAPALRSRFLSLGLTTPPPSVTSPAVPPGARTETVTTPDIAASIDEDGPWRLPERLAGLARTESGELGGAATYGEGLTRVVLLPLPGGVAYEALRRAREAAAPALEVPGGEAVSFSRPPLGVVLAAGDDGEHTYLLTGTVDTEVLRRAAAQLFADPPERR